jgi:hypothetical protein
MKGNLKRIQWVVFDIFQLKKIRIDLFPLHLRAAMLEFLGVSLWKMK